MKRELSDYWKKIYIVPNCWTEHWHVQDEDGYTVLVDGEQPDFETIDEAHQWAKENGIYVEGSEPEEL